MAPNRYLLDTHCLIWFQENNPSIPKQVMNILKDPKNTILFSQVSLFEIGIKQKLGKLPSFSASVQEVSEQAISDGFTLLPLQNQHIYRYADVPLLEQHRDPFDRLLIAKALAEEATILSADEKFTLYGDLVEVIW